MKSPHARLIRLEARHGEKMPMPIFLMRETGETPETFRLRVAAVDPRVPAVFTFDAEPLPPEAARHAV